MAEYHGEANILIRHSCQAFLPLTSPSTPASVILLFKWKKATRRQKSDSVGSHLSAAPSLFCYFGGGQYLPTEKTQAGRAVNSDELAKFIHTKFIH